MAKPNYDFIVRQLFQVSSLECNLSATTPVAPALKRGDQSSFFEVWQENYLPISSLERAYLEGSSET